MIRQKADSQQNAAPVQGDMPGFDDFELKLGDVMRGERATMGKSLLDVQRDLRIRAAHIAAIENCDVSVFDTPSFVSGYVRGYARYLGMDPEGTFHQFCIESGFRPPHGLAPEASGRKTPLRLPDDPGGLASSRTLYLPEPESFWSGVEPRAVGSLLVLLLLVGGLTFGGWSVLQEVQKVSLGPVEDAPGIITILDPVQDIGEAPADDVLAIDLPRPDLSDLTFRPQMLEAPALPARDSPIASIDPRLAPRASAEASVVVAQVEDAGFQPHPTAAIAGGAGGDPILAAMDHGPQLPEGEGGPVLAAHPSAPVEVLAVRPAWVRVTAADGTVLLEKTMDAGERYALPELESPPMLRAGNSGAVYFTVGARTYGPAAPGAQVVKQVELSPASLTERFALADPAKDSDLAQLILVASAEGSHLDPSQAVD